MAAKEYARPESCPRCQAPFHCGALAGRETCWCVELPHISPVKDLASCLCPACLALEIQSREAATP